MPRTLGLLALSGLLIVLAYPVVGVRELVFLAPLPAAWAVLRARRGWHAFLASMLAGTATFLVLLHWLIPVTVGGYVAMAGVCAGFYALAALPLRCFVLTWRLPATLALPLVALTVEVARSHVPFGGFSWFLLAHALAPYETGMHASRLMQAADLLGQVGVSALITLPAAAVIDRRAHRRFAAAGLILFAAGWGYGQWRLMQRAHGPGVTLAAVQTNIPQDNKFHPSWDQMVADFQHLQRLTIQATQGQRVDLIVWPETVIPAAVNPEALAYYRTIDWPMDRFHETIGLLADALDTPILLGAPAFNTLGEHRTNAAVWYDADGSLRPQRYEKMHLVPFGEYLPLVEDWPWLAERVIGTLAPAEFSWSLRPGDRAVRFEHQGVTIAAPICFEDVVARAARRLVYEHGRKQAQVLVNLTNDGWYLGRSMRLQHLQIAAYRCVELRVPTARSVNTGVSAILDSHGRVLAHVDQLTEGAAVHAVTPDPRTTLYGRWGELPVMLLAAATLLAWPATRLIRRQGQTPDSTS